MQKQTDSAFKPLLSVLQSEKKFIETANKLGLTVSKDRLDYYKNIELLLPVYSHEGRDLFSPFQIYVLYLIEEILRRTLFREKNFDKAVSHKEALESNKEWIAERCDGFEALLPFLHRLEPLYFNNFTITEYLYAKLGVTPRIGKLPEGRWWNKLRESGLPTQEMDGLTLTVKELELWRDRIGGLAHDLDPMEKWYHLVQNIRLNNYQKMQQLKGSAALAQLLYRMEIILRGALSDITSKDYLNPHDVYDLSGGAWRQARNEKGHKRGCYMCGKIDVTARTLDARRQEYFLCNQCAEQHINDVFNSVKPKSNQNTQTGTRISPATPLMCSNPKCNKALLHDLHEATILDKTNFGILFVELNYGEMVVVVKCVTCGHTTRRDIEVGWDIS